MKLFQNLSTDLAEEVVKSLFLFIALAAILFNIAEWFEQNFGRGSPNKNKVFFLFLALAAILFNGAERFEQFW